MEHMQAGKALLIVLGATAAFAQNSPKPEDSPRPEFEVATIRPSAPSPEAGVTAGVRIDGAQFRSAFLTLKDYLGLAYRVKLYQISGPDWISSDRFDISVIIYLTQGRSCHKLSLDGFLLRFPHSLFGSLKLR